jgi:hypothetical protein
MRTRQRDRSPRPPRPPQNGNGNGAAEKAAVERVQLNPEQSMGVCLIAARETIKQKNVMIAALQKRHAERATQDADTIKALESEVLDLTQRLMQAEINAENLQNDLLIKQLGLPEDTKYEMGPDGRYFYDRASEAPAKPQAPEPTAEAQG